MATPTALPARSEVPEELTWNLSTIFADTNAFEAAYSAAQQEIAQIAELKGTLSKGAAAFKTALVRTLELVNKLEQIFVYTQMLNDQDTTNNDHQALFQRANSLMAQGFAALSWFEPELLSLPEQSVWDYLAQDPELELYRHHLAALLTKRAHVLPAEQEALLASASEILDSGHTTFGILDNADLIFPEVTGEDGQKVRLSHGVYQTLMESPVRSVRKEAFEGLYTTYKQFARTFASTLTTNVKQHNFLANAHHFDNARAAALAGSFVPEKVFDTLVEEVNAHLPLLHRYTELRKRILGLDAPGEALHMYDLYTPLLGEPPLTFSYEDAKAKVIEALQPLGEEYLAVVRRAFAERWIDVVENKGKRGGAYSSGVYGTNPFILLNWHETLDQVFTLIHEMGHSVHSYFTRSTQPLVYGDYSIFLAEIASTTNENLLTDHLLKTETDPRIKAYVLNHYLDGFKGTVFRQTQFAEFEHWIHTQDAAGQPLTSDYISDFYAKLNARYYGPAVAADPQIAYEWARIPHFYYNYYVYQYATGFSAASALAANITAGEKNAVEHLITYLKSGCSAYPIDIMKTAGVDMTTPEYLRAAFAVFEKRLGELEALISEIQA